MTGKMMDPEHENEDMINADDYIDGIDSIIDWDYQEDLVVEDSEDRDDIALERMDYFMSQDDLID